MIGALVEQEALQLLIAGQLMGIGEMCIRDRAGTLAPWIESGQIMVISIDTIDQETWSDTNGDPYWRIRRYEQWIRYIVEEVVPKICLLYTSRCV